MSGPAFLRSPVCRFILRVGRMVPVFVVLAIVIFCYYVYCFQTVPDFSNKWWIRAILYLVLHVLLLFFLFSYFVTIFSPLPLIPDKFYLPELVLRDLWAEKSETGRNDVLFRFASHNNINVLNMSVSDGPRFCSACKCIKPDRSHHCSICGKCVLRYDHHCPWVNNCVHNENYKSFLLFLMYGLILCLFVLSTSLKPFVGLIEGAPHTQDMVNNFGTIFLPFLTFLFGLSLACLFFYHVYLVCRNRTTIEQWNPPHFEHGPDKGAYNLGPARNFRQIFGDSRLFWLIPVYTSKSDGVTFCLRRKRFFQEQLRLLDDTSSDEDNTSRRLVI